jgi:hypothetical protein
MISRSDSNRDTFNIYADANLLFIQVLFSASRMSGVIGFHELVHMNMSVALGRGQGRMAEHFLDGPQVGPRVQEMSGEGMPQTMWAQVLPHPAPPQLRLEDPSNRAIRESCAPGIEKQGRTPGPCIRKLVP